MKTLLDRLETDLLARGFESCRHKDVKRRSGILSVIHPAPLNQVEWMKALYVHGILSPVPNGYLRFFPHFMNGLQKIDIYYI